MFCSKPRIKRYSASSVLSITTSRKPAKTNLLLRQFSAPFGFLSHFPRHVLKGWLDQRRVSAMRNHPQWKTERLTAVSQRFPAGRQACCGEIKYERSLVSLGEVLPAHHHPHFFSLFQLSFSHPQRGRGRNCSEHPSSLLEGAVSPETWRWQRPRIWLCCRPIYRTKRKHLWSLPQNLCHNPELKLSLNVTYPSHHIHSRSLTPGCCFVGCTGVGHHAVLLLRPAFLTSFTLWDFIYLEKKSSLW